MESRRRQVLAVNLLFFILSWTAVSLRVYVRYEAVPHKLLQQYSDKDKGQE